MNNLRDDEFPKGTMTLRITPDGVVFVKVGVVSVGLLANFEVKCQSQFPYVEGRTSMYVYNGEAMKESLALLRSVPWLEVTELALPTGEQNERREKSG